MSLELLEIHLKGSLVAKVTIVVPSGNLATLIGTNPVLIQNNRFEVAALHPASGCKRPEATLGVEIDEDLAQIEKQSFNFHGENINTSTTTQSCLA